MACPQMCNPWILLIIYRRFYEKHKKRRKKGTAIKEERKTQGQYGKTQKAGKITILEAVYMRMRKGTGINGQPQAGNTTQASNCWRTGLLERHGKL